MLLSVLYDPDVISSISGHLSSLSHGRIAQPLLPSISVGLVPTFWPFTCRFQFITWCPSFFWVPYHYCSSVLASPLLLLNGSLSSCQFHLSPLHALELGHHSLSNKYLLTVTSALASSCLFIPSLLFSITATCHFFFSAILLASLFSRFNLQFTQVDGLTKLPHSFWHNSSLFILCYTPKDSCKWCHLVWLDWCS